MMDKFAPDGDKAPRGARAIRKGGSREALVRKRPVTAQVQSERLVSDRRQRIIRAATVVFHEHGFHNATTADIAREAGMTQSNLYNYVKSKQDVLFLVCQHLVGMYEAVMTDATEKHDDPYQRIASSVAAVIDLMMTYSDELQILYNETHALAKTDRIVILTMVSRFISKFDLLLEDYEKRSGSITLENRRLAANLMSFVPAIVAVRSWEFERHGTEGVQQLIQQFILKGLGIEPPADARLLQDAGLMDDTASA